MHGRAGQDAWRAAVGALGATAIMGAAVGASSAGSPRVVKFATPETPTQVVAAYRSIWVSGVRGGDLYRIDPARNRIVAHISTGIDTCDLEAQAGRIFAGECGGDAVRVVDPRKNRVVRRLRTMPRYYAGSLWIFRGHTLLRLDPKTHSRLKAFKKVDSEVPLEVGDGSVWVGTFTAVTRIDTATNTRALIPLPGAKTQPGPSQGFANPWRMAFAKKKVWYGNPAGIYEIDARKNNARLDRIPVGPYPDGGNIDLVAGAGSVWAGTSETRVLRIDPADGHVTGRFPGGGGDIAIAFGSLWVTKPVANRLWRVPIR